MVLTPEFKRAYTQLNDRQQEAVDAIEGPVMVIAGPGTGKTNILTLRIANILAHTDTEPGAILALTYTINAAAEMQRRLAQLIGPVAWQVTITTFHGLCEQIIHDHEERFTDLADRRVADDADRRRIMEHLFVDADYLEKLVGFGDDPYYVNPALRAIEELKREGVHPDRLAELVSIERTRTTDDPASISTRGPTKGKLKAEARLHVERMDRLDELVPLYRAYEQALARDHLYDYADMLTRVRDALTGDEILRLALQERFQYLLVDEHQDTNAVQNQIVELLAGFFDQPNLFIVGDEKQAIYRFQGASLDNFLYFKDRFKGVRLIALTENYRSSQLILDAAHGIRASQEPLRAQQSHAPTPIVLCPAQSPDAQYIAIGQRIQELLKQGDRPDQIAVLYRRNADGQELASALAHMGIPYALDAQADVLDDRDISRLLMILEAVRDYGKPGPLYEALHVPWLKVSPLNVYKLSEFSGRDRNPYDVIASMRLMGEAHLTEPDIFKQWSGRIAGWHTLARQEDVSRTLETIVQESGCLDALVAHSKGPEKLARLHALYTIAHTLVYTNRRATLIDLVDRLRYLRDKGIRLSIRTVSAPGRVRLMTAHGAKGLEFDTVFLLNCYEKHWPSPHRSSPLALPASVYRLRSSSISEESDAEERNLFFVALTRARHQVVISWPQYDRQGKELAPSRYIDLIPPSLVQTADMPAVDISPSYFAPAPVAEPELADREYLRERFIRQGFSATALNNYITCPWQYFYRNLVRIPEASNVHLMYGNAVDRALEQFFEQRRAGEPVDKTALLTHFSKTAHNQPFPEHDLRTALERGRRALDGWYEKWHTTWPTNSMHQVRIAGIPVPGLEEVTINGKLDKLEILANSDVRVVDYKTGRPKPKDENYRRQLTFYRTLLDRWQDGTYRMTEAILDFIDPDTKGNYRRESFIITPEDGNQLMQQITTTCQEILDLAFWNRTCSEKECRYCALRQLIK